MNINLGMKRILFILSISIVCLYTVSCRKDWNEEDALSQESETISFVDYKALPKTSFPALNGYFTPLNEASGFLEEWLNNKRPGAKIGEVVSITYDYMDYDHPDSLNNLSREMTVVQTEDYKEVWGDLFVESFTPSKPAATEIPLILKRHYPDAQEGAYRIVRYHQSEVEPTVELIDHVVYSEDFSTFNGSSGGAKVALPGAFNDNLTTSTRSWHIYVRNEDWGAAMYSNYNSNAGGDAWIVLPQQDLTSVQDAVFSFDFGVGYSRNPGEKDYVRVMITEEFDGQNPLNSTWTDITTELGVFDVPKETGYPATIRNLQANLPQYAGKKIYVAFRSQLPLLAGTYAMSEYYVVDNLKLSGKIEGMSIASSEEVYQVFKYHQNEWQVLNSVYVLQPSDYQGIGKEFMTPEEAHELISPLLTTRISDPEEGEKKTVLYKQDNTQFHAENYVYTSGQWKYDAAPPMEKRTAKFRYTYPDEKWKEIDLDL